MNKPSQEQRRYALLSVSDKQDIAVFANALSQAGFDILSTGGTAKALRESGVQVTDVSEYTGFPEIMGGRVKTLHPKVHGGILARRGTDDAVMQEHAIERIDLLAVNLYPFAATISQADCTFEQAIENIDIGGPAMIRAAAKNHQNVVVVTDPADYSAITDLLVSDGQIDRNKRVELAAKAFAHTAEYDSLIAHYLGKEVKTAAATSGSNTVAQDQQISTAQSARSKESASFPDRLVVTLEKELDLRYGENPHQAAAFYRRADSQAHSTSTGLPATSLVSAKRLQGKALSYNNLADADAALAAAAEFEEPSCVIVKHANPCGVASASTTMSAYELAFQCDPTSAFGGIIAINRELDGELAQKIIAAQFVEVLLATGFSEAALAALASKPAIRVLEVPSPWQDSGSCMMKSISGGMLVQASDNILLTQDGVKTVTQRTPQVSEMRDLMFAWKVAKHVKSNAIVYAKNCQSIGVGAGQMSRVYSAEIAAIKARDEGLDVAGAALASDAFFPFRDGIDRAAAAGITAIIQPGGSRNDEEVIAAANEHDIAMVFTGMRHFRH